MAGEQHHTTASHDIRSTIVNDEFRLFVASCGPQPRETLILADGNGLFGMAVDTIRMMQLPALVPPMLVVGIGYPSASALADTVDIRVRDLTPTAAAGFDRSGGADRFAGFIEHELRPWLRARAADALETTTFFGHSLGGAFGTHVLLTRPDLFSRYIISSPSLWWDDGHLFERLRADDPSDGVTDHRTSAFFGIGGLETDEGRRLEARNLPDGHRAKPPARHLDMVADLRRFVELLATHRSRVEATTVVVDDEFHATVPGPVLTHALRHFAQQRNC